MASDDVKLNAAGLTKWKQEAGVLQQFIDDPNVSEIMVNSYDHIFLEIDGEIRMLDRGFENADGLMRFAQAIAVTAGREVNRKHPCVDTRLPDGSRVSIIVPPVALDGPIITIRKRQTKAITYREMIDRGSVDDKLVVFLYQLVRCRQNLIVSGGTSSGKTTLLNMLSKFILSEERVITIEDTAELQLTVMNLVRMESKPSLGNELGVSMQDLLVSALRMRPDRIIIGECRGAEAWDMLLAMNTGHEGSMTTLHSNSAYDALRRMEAMALRSGIQAPLSMIKHDIANTINFIVHMDRQSDGKRRVVEIVEVVDRDGDDYVTKPIFTWTPENGFKTTGEIPKFVAQPTNQHLELTTDFFNPTYKYKMAG